MPADALSAGVWLGALVALVMLLAGGPAEVGARGRFGLDLAAYRLHEVALFRAFVVTLATGALFSLATPWGYFRFHWSPPSGSSPARCSG